MGHFGKKPIKIAWVFFVFPCLLFNYFGQGANLLLKGQSVLANPFYSLTGGIFLYPMIVIATIASIIASQALISGAFSLTQQAMQLGFIPRMNVIHTSYDVHGQIYIPEVNTMLMVACIGLVLAFQSSSNLASAYGMSVMGAMTITSILFAFVAVKKWGWKSWQAISLSGFFLIFDLPYLFANLTKFFHGAWFPLAAATTIFIVIITWKKGRENISKYVVNRFLPIDLFMKSVEISNKDIYRVKRTAVFMTSNINIVPLALLHHFKHNNVLHEKVILLAVEVERIPKVPKERRVEIKYLEYGFYQISAHYGYMEKPNIPRVLEKSITLGLDIDMNSISYFLGRETLLTTGNSKMFKWQKILFAFLSQNARPASSFFSIPPDRVIELGLQVQI